MSKYVSTIGNRNIEQPAKSIIFNVGKAMAESGYILRSGGALGSDETFEAGALSVGGKTEIYLPWKGSNNHKSDLYHIPSKAFAIARAFHPRWQFLKQGAQKLLARNAQIVLGQSLDKPSNMVIYWDNQRYSGTQHAVKIARAYEIPCYNLAECNQYELMDTLGI